MIDLGPGAPGSKDDGAARRKLAAAVVAGGLEPVIGDGVEDALAGQAAAADELQLGVALAEAQRAFGALDCAAASAAAQQAVGLAAARQAAGLGVPELSRALTYQLLCADRGGDVDAAIAAATALRTVGGASAPDGVPADVWAKYPAVDTVANTEMFALKITATAGADVWIDFHRAGTAPLDTFVAAGPHVFAAAKGTRRGWASGKPVKAQPAIEVPMTDQASAYAGLAAEVAALRMPASDDVPGKTKWANDIAAILDEVHARVALIRRGDTVEAWGHIGKSQPVRRLGGDDGAGKLDEAERLVALINDRVQTWNDRAPDPDAPLLTEDPRLRARTQKDEPTKWWVYAALAGAIGLGVGIVYLHDTADNTQHVELHYP